MIFLLSQLSLCWANTPEFKTNLNITDIELPNQSIHTKIDGKLFSSNYQTSYFSSCIHIIYCIFENNTGFGSLLTSGWGGSLFLYQCQCDISGCKFSSNAAACGGAVSTLETNIYIHENDGKGGNTIFVNNTAFLNGGALYCNGLKDSGITFIVNTNFESNNASQTGGAIYIGIIKDLYVYNCKFSDNEAGHNGGAVMLRSEDDNDYFQPFFSYCTFERNRAGEVNKLAKENNTIVLGGPINQRIDFEGRGCAGLAMIFCSLFTAHCIFNNNSQTNGRRLVLDVRDTLQGISGVSMMLSNVNSWNSFHDCVPDYLTYTSKKTKPQIVIHRSESQNDCRDIPNFYQIPGTSPNSNRRNTVSNVPSPTTFTYHATPIIITKLKTIIVTPCIMTFTPTLSRPPTMKQEAKTPSIPPSPTAISVPEGYKSSVVLTNKTVETYTLVNHNTSVLTYIITEVVDK